MKVLVFGINYHPELTGIGKYTAEMCTWLSQRDHEVDVITAMPYYPHWEIQDKYKNKWWHTELIDKVKVQRCPLYVPTSVSGAKRIIHEFSFLLSSSLFWLKSLTKKYDVVVCVCPPFHLAIPALIYRFFKGTPIVYHIQDLQVDAARNLNILKSQSLLNILEKTEKCLINKVNYVSSISLGMKQKILKKGVSEYRYIHLPNWVDTDFIQPLNSEKSLKSELGYTLEDKVVLYSGNMGEKQGLEIVMEAAERLKGVQNLHFLFVGEGANKSKMQKIALEKNLSNIRFTTLFPYSQISKLLASADIHLVIQKSNASDLMLPSKLLSILSAGGLALVTALPNTSLYNIIVDNQAGQITTPEDANVLSENILKILSNDFQVVKSNARKYALEELNIDKILLKFESILRDKIIK